jgi:cell division protein FtsW
MVNFIVRRWNSFSFASANKSKERSYLANFDQLLLGITVCLILFGVYLQFNIATSLGDNFQMSLFLGQLRSLVFASLVFVVFFFPRKLSDFLFTGSSVFLFTLIALLVFVLLHGVSTQGSVRWIRLPFFSFQPSQLAHPVLIICFAKAFDIKKHIIKQTGFVRFLQEFAPLLLFTGFVFLLIYWGRHLSTLIVLGLTLISMILVAEFKKSLIVILSLIILVGCIGAIFYGAKYRSDRMAIYAKYSLFHKALGLDKKNIDADTYQVRESLLAVSQGGFFGTGSEKGRAKHKFLPDVNSDYIYAMIAEQFGFLGGFIILFLYTLFFFRTILNSLAKENLFKKLVILGMGVNIFISASVNIGVALSALPSTGFPLPFISHGGSALAVNVGMLAVILNFSSKRKYLNAK